MICDSDCSDCGRVRCARSRYPSVTPRPPGLRPVDLIYYTPVSWNGYLHCCVVGAICTVMPLPRLPSPAAGCDLPHTVAATPLTRLLRLPFCRLVVLLRLTFLVPAAVVCVDVVTHTPRLTLPPRVTLPLPHYPFVVVTFPHYRLLRIIRTAPNADAPHAPGYG